MAVRQRSTAAHRAVTDRTRIHHLAWPRIGPQTAASRELDTEAVERPPHSGSTLIAASALQARGRRCLCRRLYQRRIQPNAAATQAYPRGYQQKAHDERSGSEQPALH